MRARGQWAARVTAVFVKAIELATILVCCLSLCACGGRAGNDDGSQLAEGGASSAGRDSAGDAGVMAGAADQQAGGSPSAGMPSVEPDVAAGAGGVTDPGKCHEPGRCDPSNGACVEEPVVDGTACASDDACFLEGACQSGRCVGKKRMVCAYGDPCVAGECITSGCHGLQLPSVPAPFIADLPTYAMTADFNGDGRLDVASAGHGVHVLLGLGDGRFEPEVRSLVDSPFTAARVGDLNGDDLPDLVASNAVGNTVTVLVGQGDGTFVLGDSYNTGTPANSLAVADVNADGWPDLAVATSNPDPGNIQIFLNQQDGRLASESGSYADGIYPMTLTAADVTGDGYPDLVFGRLYGGLGLVKNRGDGSFGAPEELQSTYNGEFIVAGDLNGDAHVDLVAIDSLNNVVSLLFNDGSGHSTSSGSIRLPVQPSGAALADFDGDGALDLAIPDLWFATLNVFLNRGDGVFAEPVAYPAARDEWSVSAADLNADGAPDLIAPSQSSGRFSILLNRADGTFTSPVRQSTSNVRMDVYAIPLRTEVMDLNADGLPDLAVVNNAINTVGVLLNTGGGHFAGPLEYPIGKGPEAIRAVDVTNDGKPDLVTANFQSDSISILVNSNGGTFESAKNYATVGNPSALAVVDLDRDGSVDVVVGHYFSASLGVLFNSGSGAFAAPIDYAVGDSPLFILPFDLNEDGWSDLVVSNRESSTVSVLLNHGDGSLSAGVQYATRGGPRDIALLDFDRDGRLDLVVANSQSDALSVFVNRGDGTLEAAVDVPASLGSSSVVAVDVNGDTLPDLVLNGGGAPNVLLNMGTAFAPPVYFNGGKENYSVGASDLNGDGRIDLIATDSATANVTLLFNTCSP